MVRKMLLDPKRLFGYQHVALVIDHDKLDRLGGDRFMKIINTRTVPSTERAAARRVSEERCRPRSGSAWRQAGVSAMPRWIRMTARGRPHGGGCSWRTTRYQWHDERTQHPWLTR
jgi:hypothetical protein